MKKIICLILAMAALLSFTSCKNDEYKPVASTDEESLVVMTLSYEGKTYNIKYELYRALFLNFKSEVDGGDNTVWSGDNKAEYIQKIDTLIKEKLSEIYSAFHIADKLGINLYSKSYEEEIKNYIKTSVDGGVIGSNWIEGFGGDYSKYLESLKAMNLNYSVQVLLIRYSLALTAINEYYAGSQNNLEENTSFGAIKYTEDDVHAFYNGDDCVRVLTLILPCEYFTKERAEEIRNTVASKPNEDEAAAYMMGMSAESANKNGIIIAKHNVDKSYYGEISDAAFALANFGTSPIIEIASDFQNGYAIIYRTPKSEEHFKDCYNDVVDAYLQNEIGKVLDTASAGVISAIAETDALKNLDRSTITMK